MYKLILSDATVLLVAAENESAARELFEKEVGIAAHGDVIAIQRCSSPVYCLVETKVL